MSDDRRLLLLDALAEREIQSSKESEFIDLISEEMQCDRETAEQIFSSFTPKDLHRFWADHAYKSYDDGDLEELYLHVIGGDTKHP